jgi:hypothetical protein
LGAAFYAGGRRKFGKCISTINPLAEQIPMKKINPSRIALILFFGCMINAQISGAQHLLVLKSNKQKVIKVYQENEVSVYYSEWPDTTRNDVKAVLQNDISSLTPIISFQVDSIFAVVSAERELKIEENAQKEHMKRMNKHQLYLLPKMSLSFFTNRLHYGGFFEAGLEFKNNYRVGLGIGYEGTNQGRGFIYTTQLPVLISGNYLVMKPNKKKIDLCFA